MEKDSTQARPEIIRYRGDQLVMIGQVPSEFGPGDIACFDLDGKGGYERQVCADKAGLYTIAMAVGQLPHNGKFSRTT